MGRLFFLLFFAVTSVVSIRLPWIGVVCAYLVAVLEPQAVWFWDFEGIRPVMWVLLPTCIGIVIGLVRRQFDLATLADRRNLYILILWLSFVLSYYLGPYTFDAGPPRFLDPGIELATLNKMLLLYFMACLCIDTERKLRVMFYVVAASGAYLVYWGNSQSLSGHVVGRLAGPTDLAGVGIYADENAFAMLFVVVQSFLWFLGGSFRNRLLRWGCWLVIPFCWNGVFLTASRGGLLGLGITTLLIALRSRSRLLGLALIPAFALAFYWEAGDLMRSRADTITEYQTEASAADRIEAWHAAARMIADHPLTGVGLASFGPAFPHYSDKPPREAHNTFLQISAESGILAGLMYLLITFRSVVRLWRNGSRMRRLNSGDANNMILPIGEATLIALCGLFVVSLFLSMQMFEIFYCLNVIANAILYLERKKTTGTASLPAAGRARRALAPARAGARGAARARAPLK